MRAADGPRFRPRRDLELLRHPHESLSSEPSGLSPGQERRAGGSRSRRGSTRTPGSSRARPRRSRWRSTATRTIPQTPPGRRSSSSSRAVGDPAYLVELVQTVEVPIGAGFGSSSASALSAVMAVASALELPSQQGRGRRLRAPGGHPAAHRARDGLLHIQPLRRRDDQ